MAAPTGASVQMLHVLAALKKDFRINFHPFTVLWAHCPWDIEQLLSPARPAMTLQNWVEAAPAASNNCLRDIYPSMGRAAPPAMIKNGKQLQNQTIARTPASHTESIF